MFRINGQAAGEMVKVKITVKSVGNQWVRLEPNKHLPQN